GELVGCELVREDHLVVLVPPAGSLEVHDGTLPVEVGDQVNDSDKRKIEACDVERERLFGRLDVPDLWQLLAHELLEKDVAGLGQFLPGLSWLVGDRCGAEAVPQLLEGRHGTLPGPEQACKGLVDDLSEDEACRRVPRPETLDVVEPVFLGTV